MALSLTQSEIDALLAERQQLIFGIPIRQESILKQGDVIAKATDTDNAQRKLFNFYDTDVLANYLVEREMLTGEYIAAPVTLAGDLEPVGNLDATNRCYPPIGQTAPVRIIEFDGGGLSDVNNRIDLTYFIDTPTNTLSIESYWISRQLEIQNYLQNGFGGTSPSVSGIINLSNTITSTTTQITLFFTVLTSSPTISPGNTFLIRKGGDQVAVQVVSVIDSDIDMPSFEAEFELEIRVLSMGTISSGTVTIFSGWSGFTNADRIAKSDSVNGFDYLMTQLTNQLDFTIQERISKLNTQISAINSNEDPAIDLTAATNATTSLNYLTNWAISKDIDDATFSGLTTESSTRSSQFAPRITTINNAMTSFYTPRYTAAVDLADTSRGTIRIKNFRIGAQDQTSNILAAEQARLQSIEDLLTIAGIPF